MLMCFSVLGAEKEELVPYSFNQEQCSRGYMWRFDNYGKFRSGYMEVGQLNVNSNRFRCDQPRMVKKTGELVLSNKTGGLDVTRRILFDKKKSSARYVEVFHNPTSNDMKVQVMLHVEFNMSGPAMKKFTTTGKGLSTTLGKKDSGFVTGYQQNANMHFGSQMNQMGDLVWILTSPRNKNKPTVQPSGNNNQNVIFSLTVKGNETASLVHCVVQRNNVTQSNVEDALDDFIRYGRLVHHKVPDHLRNTVVNFTLKSGFSGRRLAGHAMHGINMLVDELAIERGPFDVLVLNEETRLSGAVSCKGLHIETTFGTQSIEFADVAAITGGAQTGSPVQLYLRNGEILTGLLTADGVTMLTRSNMEFQLPADNIKALIMHTSKEDGEVPDTAAAFLSTCSGDRLLLKDKGPIPLHLLCPWGVLDVQLEKKDQLLFSRELQPGYRLLLHNGTSLSVVPLAPELTFETCRYGAVTFTARNLFGLVWISEENVLSSVGAPGNPTALKLTEAVRKKLAETVLKVKFDNAALSQVISHIKEKTGIPIAFDPEFKDHAAGKKVTFEFMGSAEEGLKQILKKTSCRAQLEEGSLLISSSEKAPPQEAAASETEEENGGKTLTQPYLNLTGNNLLVGSLALSEITLNTELGITPVAVSELLSMKRSEDSTEKGVQRFDLQLKNGNALSGVPCRRLFPVAVREKTLTIPLEHIVSYSAPETKKAAVPAEGTEDAPSEAVEENAAEKSEAASETPPAEAAEEKVVNKELIIIEGAAKKVTRKVSPADPKSLPPEVQSQLDSLPSEVRVQIKAQLEQELAKKEAAQAQQKAEAAARLKKAEAEKQAQEHKAKKQEQQKARKKQLNRFTD